MCKGFVETINRKTTSAASFPLGVTRDPVKAAYGRITGNGKRDIDGACDRMT